MSFRSTILRDTAANFGALLFSVAGGLASSILVARYLGPSGTGAYVYVAWTAAVLGTIGEGGMSFALTKYVAQLRGAGRLQNCVGLANELLKRQLWIGFGAVGIIVVIRFAVPAYPFPELLLYACAIVFPWIVSQGFTAALAGSGRFDLTSMFTALGAVLQVALVAIVIAFRGGAAALLFNFAVKLSVPLLLGWWAWRRISRTISASPIVDRADLSNAQSFAGLSLAITILFMILWQRSEVFFVERYCTVAEVAFFSISYSVVELIGEGAAAFSRVLLQRASLAFGESGVGGVSKYFSESLRYLQLVLVPGCAFVAVLAPVLVENIYGAAYAPMTPILRILVGAAAFSTLTRVVISLLLSSDHGKVLVRQWAWFVVADLLLAWWAIMHWGVVGGAAAKSLVQVLATAFALQYCVSKLSTSFPFRSTFKIYLATAIAVLPALAVITRNGGSWMLAAAVIVGVSLYLLLLVALREVSKADVDLLRQLSRTRPSAAIASDTPEVI